MIIKQLKEWEYSEDRKKAMKEMQRFNIEKQKRINKQEGFKQVRLGEFDEPI